MVTGVVISSTKKLRSHTKKNQIQASHVHDVVTRHFQQQYWKGISWPQSPPTVTTLTSSSSIASTTTTTQTSLLNFGSNNVLLKLLKSQKLSLSLDLCGYVVIITRSLGRCRRPRIEGKMLLLSPIITMIENLIKGIPSS